jgi:hypothetical protein
MKAPHSIFKFDFSGQIEIILNLKVEPSMEKPNKRDLSYLSKSLFLRGLQCPKSLYLYKTQPDLRDEISEAQGAVFQAGTEVGIIAQCLFPGGKVISYDGMSLDAQLKLTQAEITAGTLILYEPAFQFDKVFVKVDILRKVGEEWDLYEVKGSTGIKDLYLNDIALQYYVLKNSGLPIRKAYLVYINNQYVRNGALDLDQLFLFEEITPKSIEMEGFVREEIGRLRGVLTGNIPEIDIGEQCSDPYPCDFQGHCWSHIPEYSVLDLVKRGAIPWDLYRQGFLRLEDIPKDLLSPVQLLQVEAYLERKEFVNTDGIREFLSGLWDPLYFLDFETFYTPIPIYDGTRPYQQVPYQYSLHYLQGGNSDLGHSEFLAPPNTDPRRPLVEKLVGDIPDRACVLAYNAAFEKMIIRQLADWFPEHRVKLEMIIDNLRDLAAPFRARDVYRWEMKGSYSQKSVLPSLVPGMTYQGMEISDGGMAMEGYFRMCAGGDPDETEKVRQALLEYCRMDTFGMVRLYEKLRELAC